MNKKQGLIVGILVLIIIILFALFQTGIFDEFISSIRIQQMFTGQTETTTTIRIGTGGNAADYITNPANPLGAIQYNDNYKFGADPNLTWNETTNILNAFSINITNGTIWNGTDWFTITDLNASTIVSANISGEGQNQQVAYFNSTGQLNGNDAFTFNGSVLSAHYNFTLANGSVGYWSRTGTVLSPITVGDDITTTGLISGHFNLSLFSANADITHELYFEGTLDSATQDTNDAEYNYTWDDAEEHDNITHTDGDFIISFDEAGEYDIYVNIIVLDATANDRATWELHVDQLDSSSASEFEYSLGTNYIRDDASLYDSGGRAGHIKLVLTADEKIIIRSKRLDSQDAGDDNPASQSRSYLRIFRTFVSGGEKGEKGDKGEAGANGTAGYWDRVGTELTQLNANDTVTIASTDPEALLVRKLSDADDVFTVDTSNSRVTLGNVSGVNVNGRLQIVLEDTDTSGITMIQNTDNVAALTASFTGFQKFAVGDRSAQMSMSGISNILDNQLDLTGNLGGVFISESDYGFSNTLQNEAVNDATGVQVLGRVMTGMKNSVSDTNKCQIDTSFDGNQHLVQGMWNIVTANFILDVAGETVNYDVYGVRNQVNTNPVETAGTISSNVAGEFITVSNLGNPTNGQINVYGIFLDTLSNSDSSGDLFGIFDDTGVDWAMRGDTGKFYQGAGDDVYSLFNGNDYEVKQEVGNGDYLFTGGWNNVTVEKDLQVNGTAHFNDITVITNKGISVQVNASATCNMTYTSGILTGITGCGGW